MHPLAHEVGEPLDVVVRMGGREGQAQARGAVRHGRRADRDHEKAFVLQPPACRVAQPSDNQRSGRSYPRSSMNARYSAFVTLYLLMVKAGVATVWASNSLSHPNVPSLRNFPSVALPAGIVSQRGAGAGRGSLIGAG